MALHFFRHSESVIAALGFISRRLRLPPLERPQSVRGAKIKRGGGKGRRAIGSANWRDSATSQNVRRERTYAYWNSNKLSNSRKPRFSIFARFSRNRSG